MPEKPLADYKSLGPKSQIWLHEIGIHTIQEIEDLGAVEVYKRLKAAFPKQITLNMLYGLQAAILDIHWQAITPDMKEELKRAAQD